MPKYLYEYVDAEGKRGHAYIEAASATEAGRALVELGERSGYPESRLLDDDLLAQLRERRTPVQLSESDLARVEALVRRGGGRRQLLAESLRQNRWLLLIIIALIVYGLINGQNLALYAGFTGLAVFVVMFLRLSGPSDLYRRLIIADATGDNDAVFELADKLAALASKKPLMAFDIDMRKAGVLAKKGRLDEALELSSRHVPDSVHPKGIYWDRLAVVYAKAGRYDKAVECMRRCVEESGNAVWAQVDLALFIALLGENPGEALERLDREDIKAQPETVMRFVNWARGVAYLRLGDPAVAEPLLGEAVNGFMKQSSMPVVWVPLALATAALAVAVSMNGRAEEAGRRLSPMRKLFDAHADAVMADLVERYVPKG